MGDNEDHGGNMVAGHNDHLAVNLIVLNPQVVTYWDIEVGDGDGGAATCNVWSESTTSLTSLIEKA